MATMREIQLCTLNILEEVVRICDKHNLTYYLSSGTLLGAIRHKGFIPWDNDIDIEMPIEDYRKFLRIAPKEISNDFFIQTFESDRNYNFTWTQVRANNTTSLIMEYINWNIHWGMHLDIFPLVGIYTNDKLKKLQLKSLEIGRALINKEFLSVCMPEELSSNKKLQLMYKLPRSLRVFLCRILFRFTFKNTHNSKYISTISGYGNGIEYKLDQKAYGTNINKVLFENSLYRAPEDTDYVLTALYGDYMTPPPESERHFGHEGIHGKIIYDCNMDYKHYLETLRNK